MKILETCDKTRITTWRGPCGALQRKSAVLLLLLGAMLALAAPMRAGPMFKPHGDRDVDVMQVNLYIGGGIDRIMALDPSDPNYLTELVTTVTGIYYEIVASQPAVRMQSVAEQIAARMPDLVSVEEASLIRVQSPGDLVVGGTSPATYVVFDYLKILTNALAARGMHYAVVSTANEIDVEMPMVNLQTGGFDDVRLTDREAILVRTDLPPGQLRVTHPQSGNFENVIQIPATGMSVTRGWCSVDVSVRGQNFRYLCPHLEEETAAEIQALEALELLKGPANVRMPVLIVGDFNADSFGRDGSFAYGLFPAAGFKDVWTAVHHTNRAGGLTWGHDEFLADPTVPFDRRIDLVFYRGADWVPQSADVLDLWLGRDSAPLWASDHAAVSAEFRFK
jgi:endonuclease/exonuclease/phosphatase family metal-dependent hydrolase